MSDAVISFPMFGEDFALNPSRYITLFGKPIYFYGIVIACAFLLAVSYTLHRHKDFGLTQDNILDMLLCAVPSAIVGARIYYVVFNPDNYFGAGKWINIIKIWEGGMAIYGGIIFAAIAVVIYSRNKKVPLGSLLDIGGLGLLIGQAIGRWGNFFNREAYGAVTDVFCKMGLTTSTGTIYVHPTFLYESLWNAVGFLFLHFYSKKHRKFDGQLFLMYVAWYGLGRYFIEGLRSDSLYIINDIRISQLLALISFGAALVILLRTLMNRKGALPVLYRDRVAAAAHDSADAAADESNDTQSEE